MNYKNQQLKGVIKYSESMLREAEKGNWNNVFAIEEHRSELIKKIYSNPSSADERDNNNEQILQILVLNRQIETLTSRVRDATRRQVGSVNRGRQVVNAYAQNTG